MSNSYNTQIWLLLLFHARNQVYTASVPPQVQLYEQKISQSNNTDYVRDVMRQAKSAEMRNYMQTEVDACDDFFSYACGNWAKINPTNARNVLETNFFKQLLSTYEQKQLKMLEVKDDSAKDADDLMHKVRTFFGACRQLNKEKRKRYKLKLWEIAAEFGQMPVLMPEGTWEASAFDWLHTIARIQNKYGLDIILQLGVREDLVNKTVSKLFIGQPPLALQNKAMYKSADTQWQRDKYLAEIAQALQKHLGIAAESVAMRTALEILNFETRLADGLMDKSLGKTLKSLAVLRTVDEMLAAYAGAIDVRTYFNISLGQELNDTFYEYHVEYQANLLQIMHEIPKEQVANYILYQLLKTFFLDFEAINGAKERLCLDKTKLYFAKVLDNIIFRKYNSAKTVEDIELIWLKIKEIFKEELESNKLKWMSTLTRQAALEKLEAMRLEINSYNETKLAKEFHTLTLSSMDYIENMKQILIHQTQRALANLKQAPKSLEMPVALSSYTPAYIGRDNLIKIPVMLLQPNFLWSAHYPQALKFATLGYLVAHELIHGFDDMGCHFNANGNEQFWWDANSTVAFNERKKCFKQQYALYRYNGKYLPTSELQAENIADNGGVQLAYSAYMKWLDELRETKSAAERSRLLELEMLPNMHFTNRQLFFIAFAQYWCNDVSERYRDNVSLISLHAPAKFRVIGSLANFRSFADEFQCAIGSTMHPKEKCQIY
ncbi:endothelin-converting enzyme 1-like [Eurosta solidaginis]|uniref:endothelin-converting enzyme 1-like n=1 Tax=Eurosta solidaginis TaxID=178769 RepID=UPI003530B911